jgi:predicted nucleic acid-binding protein
MEGIRQRLAGHDIIGLDTSVFIYHVEAHPQYLSITQEILAGVQEGQWLGITSTVTVMELTVRPRQLGHTEVARDYEALLVHFPHLTLLDVTRDVAREAAQLRANFRIRPADALQIGAALVNHATAFVTNDHALRRVNSILDVVILDDF